MDVGSGDNIVPTRRHIFLTGLCIVGSVMIWSFFDSKPVSPPGQEGIGPDLPNSTPSACFLLRSRRSWRKGEPFHFDEVFYKSHEKPNEHSGRSPLSVQKRRKERGTAFVIYPEMKPQRLREWERREARQKSKTILGDWKLLSSPPSCDLRIKVSVRKLLPWFISISWGSGTKDYFASLALVMMRSFHLYGKGQMIPILMILSDIPFSSSSSSPPQNGRPTAPPTRIPPEEETAATSSSPSSLEEDPMFMELKFLVESAGGIVVLKPIKDSYPFRFTSYDEASQGSRMVWAGSIGRVEGVHFARDYIPRLFPHSYYGVPDEGSPSVLIDQERILYTDTDILFQKGFNVDDWPTPRFISLGSMKPNDGPFNAGITMINTTSITPEIIDQVFAKGGKEGWFHGVDQYVLHSFFPRMTERAMWVKDAKLLARAMITWEDGVQSEHMYREMYPSRYNYHCFWGKELSDGQTAHIIHFVGPKPGCGRGLSCIYREADDAPPGSQHEVQQELDNKLVDRCKVPPFLVPGYRELWTSARTTDNFSYSLEVDALWERFRAMKSGVIPEESALPSEGVSESCSQRKLRS